ncbi:MAG: glutaredoxin domain-containing protein [Thermomicrobiales bacterium]
MVDELITEQGAPANDGLTVYGTTWCGDTKRSRALLDRLGVEYGFVDIDQAEAAGAWVEQQNNGSRSVPTIAVTKSGPVLTEPSDAELETALREQGLL